MKRLLFSLLPITLLLVLVINYGCKKDEDEKENKSPVVSSVLVTPNSVSPGGTATVTVQASDPDGDAITYSYTPSGGAITGNSSTVTWTAPVIPGSYSVTVTVNDGKGGQASGNGALTVLTPQTAITGTASFPAGTSGDLSNSKVSIYTSWDNWYYNQPLKFVAVSGTGSTVNWTMTDVIAGNYYLDVWKDIDNNAQWSVGDYVGWYGSGGLGSPNLTEFQVAQGETKNLTVQMYIIAKGFKLKKL